MSQLSPKSEQEDNFIYEEQQADNNQPSEQCRDSGLCGDFGDQAARRGGFVVYCQGMPK